MKKIIISILIICCLLATSTIDINASGSKGLDASITPNSKFLTSKPFNGYVLYTKMWGGTTYLIDGSKQVVHKWKNLPFGMDVHLLKNGNLLRTFSTFNFYFGKQEVFSGGTGGVEMRDWNNTLLWKFKYSDNEHLLHHDIEPMPNGDILMIAYEIKTHDEAINAGRNPDILNDNGIWPDHIIEVDPKRPNGNNIVWEWHAWDHIIQDYDSTKANYGVVADNPELIDINLYDGLPYLDWLHTNSVDYNEEFDQILLCSPHLNEIFVIDHSTTTKEAAGHTGGRYGKGGDILYRWGNPQNYRAGNKDDQQFFFQHDSRWIEPGCPGAGHIIVFNSQGNPSSVDEIVPPVDSNGNYYLEPGHAYGPDKPIWSITSQDPYYFDSHAYSGAQRLPDGNTFISSADQLSFFLISPTKNLIWKLVYSKFKLGETFKMEYYPPDYPGLNCLSLNKQSCQNSPAQQTKPNTQPSSELISKIIAGFNTLFGKTGNK